MANQTKPLHRVISPSSTKQEFATSGTTRMTILDSGNVGIGTSDPQRLLHLQKTGGDSAILRIDTNNQSHVAGIELMSGHGNWGVYNSDTIGDALEFRDDSAGVTRMIIDTRGNVGIGTGSPVNNGTNSQGLTINGTGNYQNLALQKDGTTQFLMYLNGTSGTFFDQVTADPMIFMTSDTNRVQIHSNGKVGFSAQGAGDPGTVPRSFAFYSEGATNGTEFRSNDHRLCMIGSGGSGGTSVDDGYLTMSSQGTAKLWLNANGTSQFNGGAVGINRTPAITNCKLEVGGADNVNLIAVEASGRTFGLGVVGGSGSSRGGKIFINTGLWCTANIEGNTSYTPDGLYGGSATPTRIKATGSGELLLGYKDHGSGLYSAAMALSYDAIDGLSNTAYVDGFLMRDISSNATTHLVIETDGDIKNTNNSYGSLSDERIKSDIADASSQWDDIKALKIRKYKLATQPAPYKDKFQIGVIAQELEAAGMNGLIKESDPDTKHIEHDASLLGQKVKSVKYSVLHMKALKALQEAMTRIETLEAKVATLEG